MQDSYSSLILEANFKFNIIGNFKKIATALAFSDRAESLLHEAIRIKERLNSELLLIHVGVKNDSLNNKLNDLLEKVGLDRDKVKVVWEVGKPVDVLSRVCMEKRIDLLVLGAIQHEKMIKYYMGSVARKISRKPPCSLLLVTHPNNKESRLNSIVVNGVDHPKTANTIHTALKFSNSFEVNEVTIVEEVSPSKLKTRIDDNKTLQEAFEEKERLKAKENKRIQDIIKSTDENKDKADIELKCIFGKEGYSIGHFAEITNADLLVMNSPDKKLGFLDRFFPHDLEYILSDMPCDLMIVHRNI